MATSGIDRVAQSGERVSETASTSDEARFLGVHTHLPPLLYGDKSQIQRGAAPTWSFQPGEAPHFKVSSARRHGGTEAMPQEDTELFVSLVKDRARSHAGFATANVLRHGLGQYHCAPRGFVIGYSSPAHILKQRARSHAVLCLAHGVSGPEELLATKVHPSINSSMCQSVGCGHATHAHNQHHSTPCQRLQREEEEEACFQTLHSTSFMDVRDYVSAEGAEKSEVAVRHRSSSTSDGKFLLSCSSSAAKPCLPFSRMLPSGDRNGRGQAREAASFTTNKAYPVKGGLAVAVKRTCAKAAGTYTGLVASVRKAQPATNPEAAAENLHTFGKVSGVGINDATGTAHLEPPGGSMQEHALYGKKAVMQRDLKPSNRAVVSGDHSLVKRGGKTLRVLPAPPPLSHKEVGKRAPHRVCEFVRSRGVSARQSLSTQRRPDCASLVPLHVDPSALQRPLNFHGYSPSHGNPPSPNFLQERRRLETIRATFPNPSRQVAPGNQADPCVASQITEHSWMFPRDEYRPPLSPHIPFNLDEDEDATASALLVNLTDDSRPPKDEPVEDDEFRNAGGQTQTHILQGSGEQGNHCQGACADESSGTAESRFTGERYRRKCTGQESPHCQVGEGAPSECERSSNAPETLRGDGREGTGLAKACQSATAVERLSDSRFVSSQAGERQHTPPTDWCTTLSTGWLTSSATAAENIHHTSSTPGCKPVDVELTMKFVPVGGLKTVNHSIGYGTGCRQDASPLGTAAVPVLASQGDAAHPPGRHPADQSPCTLASRYCHLQKAFCLPLAEVEHIPLSSRAPLKRDHVECEDENAEGVKTHIMMCEALAHPCMSTGPKGKRGIEESDEGVREHIAPVSPSCRATQSSHTSLLAPNCRRRICHSLSDSAIQKQPSSQLHSCYTYTSSRTHPTAMGSDFLDRADALGRRNRFPICRATKQCSVDQCTGSRPPDLFRWQTVENEVKPPASSSQHSRSIRDILNYFEEESTTSDNCSSECTSEETSTSSPLPQKTRTPFNGALFPGRAVKGKYKETFFFSQRCRYPLVAGVLPGGRAAVEMLLRAQGNVQEADSMEGGKVPNNYPLPWIQYASRRSCTAASALEEVAKDLAVARMLSTQQRTELLNAKYLTGRRQKSISITRDGSRKPISLETKEQPSFRAWRRWRFWSWTFGRRGHANSFRREP